MTRSQLNSTNETAIISSNEIHGFLIPFYVTLSQYHISHRNKQ